MLHFLNRLIQKWLKTQDWLKIIVCMIIGVSLGLTFKEKANYLKPLATLFINSVMMMITPVVFVSLVCGVISMKDPSRMGRIAAKTILLYFVTMSSGSAIALFISSFFFSVQNNSSLVKEIKPLDLPILQSKTVGVMDNISNIIPQNIVVAFVEGNILQIIVFGLMFGLMVNLAGEKGKPIEEFFQSLSSVIFKLVQMIMSTAPYGILALMAVAAGTQGLGIIAALMKMVGVIYFCMFIVMCLIYGGGLTLAKLSPFPFFKKMLEAQVVAFSTTSSAATLPVNMRVAENKLGVSKGISSFVLPLGASINMDGLSTYMGVIALFTASLYGIQLSLHDMLTVVFTSTIAAMGCAGVPAAGLIVLPMVLGSVGLPLDVIGLVAAVNRIIDMMSTTMNITGDAFSSVIIAKTESELDIKKYHDLKAGQVKN